MLPDPSSRKRILVNSVLYSSEYWAFKEKEVAKQQRITAATM